MTSRSPDRHTFQRDAYIKRQQEAGESVDPAYLSMYDDMIVAHAHKFDDPKHCVNNMEYDLLTTDWILAKARSSDAYAQNLYAAMCNMRFVRKDMFPYLRQDPDKDLWSASWRSAGGIVADMQQKGDYMDWYCSGIGGKNVDYTSEETDHQWQSRTGYVPESVVTDEIREDLLRLGWIPVPWDNDNAT